MNPITELVAQLTSASARARRARWFGALFHFGVASDIARDIERDRRRQAADAYSAEQADLEAAKLIRRVTLDGHVTRAELPALARALRHIRRSARADHRICHRAQP